MLSDLIKASAEYKEFFADIYGGKLSHAYLLLGADTAVRQLYIKILSAAILCPYKGCTNCPVCEKIFADNHSDIKVFNGDGKLRVVDAVAIIDDAYIKGWESDIKLYFIDNADSLSVQVQNKLLKIYEEPPKGVIIFLLAASQSGLLQTTLSRAKKAYLPTLTAKNIYEQLLQDGYPPKEADAAVALCGGRLDRAYLFAANHDYSLLYDECMQVLLKCKTSKDIPAYTGKAIFSKDNLPATLDILEVILSDVLALVAGSGVPSQLPNRSYDIQEISKGFSAGGAAMAQLSINKAKRMLASYVSAAGIADTILFEILEAKYKWR